MLPSLVWRNMKNNLLEKALEYANMGFHVFPCREKYEGTYIDKDGIEQPLKWKEPRITKGFLSATTEPSQIEKWWTRKGWQESAIGVSCGPSNLFVIDIDIRGTNGIENFSRMLISHENAWHSITANNGYHIIFHDPNSLGTTKTGRKEKIDTRGVGGYFIIPPSYLYDENGIIKKYTALEEWKGRPQEISIDALKKLGIIKEKKEKTIVEPLPHSEEVSRVYKAMEKIPSYVCDSYTDWLSVGMALYSLGSDGLYLWKQWSQKSSKYQDGVCERKWETFHPNDIGLGTIFYWAKEGSNGK